MGKLSQLVFRGQCTPMQGSDAVGTGRVLVQNSCIRFSLVCAGMTDHVGEGGAVLRANEVLQQLAFPAPQVHHLPHP